MLALVVAMRSLGQQLEWLLEGIDISKIQPHPARHYRIQA
jgi:hypothetical protein